MTPSPTPPQTAPVSKCHCGRVLKDFDGTRKICPVAHITEAPVSKCCGPVEWVEMAGIEELKCTRCWKVFGMKMKEEPCEAPAASGGEMEKLIDLIDTAEGWPNGIKSKNLSEDFLCISWPRIKVLFRSQEAKIRVLEGEKKLCVGALETISKSGYKVADTDTFRLTSEAQIAARVLSQLSE